MRMIGSKGPYVSTTWRMRNNINNNNSNSSSNAVLFFWSEMCRPADPSDTDCVSQSCSLCDVDPITNTSLFILQDLVVEFDCVHARTSTFRQSNGLPYNWMIMCGPVQTPVACFQWNAGDWVCTAVRSGAGFTDTDGGILADYVSCHFCDTLNFAAHQKNGKIHPIFPLPDLSLQPTLA